MENPMLPRRSMVVEHDDQEVVLQGSELDSILSRHEIKTETYGKTSKEENVPNVPSEEPPKLRRDPAVIDLLEQLLHSGLLLDEDAASLAEYCDDIDQDTAIGRFDRRLPLLLLTGCISLSRSRWCFLSVFVSSISVTTMFLFDKYQNALRRKSIDRLTNEMGEMSKLLRNVILHVKDTSISIDSRNLLLNNRNSHRELVEIFYAKLKKDLTSYSNAVVNFVLEAIKLTKEATVNNISTCFLNRRDLFFISYLAPEELGLPEENCLNLPLQKLEELFHVYLLLQSEHLKSVGLMFSSESTDCKCNPVKLVNHFLNQFSKTLSTARHKFSNGIYSRLAAEPTARSRKSKSRNIEYAQLEDVLSRILRDAYNLKGFMADKESISSDDVDFLEMGLNSLESSVNDFLTVSKKVQRIVNKGENVSRLEVGLTNVMTVKEPCVDKTRVELGHSDFSIADEDNVYLSIGDFNDNSSENIQDVNTDEPTLTYPKNLLIELRGALEGRRILFRQREFEAISRQYTPEIVGELDAMGSDEAQILEVDNKLNKQRRKAKRPLDVLPQVENTAGGSFETNGQFDFQKKLAQSVANVSLAWKNTEEECFGDSVDDIE